MTFMFENLGVYRRAVDLADRVITLTKADRRNFFIIARGSILECVPLIGLAGRHGLIQQDDREAMRREFAEIARMVSGLIKGLDNRAT